MLDNKITEKEYRNHPAINQSRLKLIINKSPLHYNLNLPVKESEEMRFGKAYHEALMRPDFFKANYFVLPSVMPNGEKINKRKKADKEYIEQVKAEHLDKIVIEEDDVEALTGMLKSVADHKIASTLFRCGEAEVPHFWEHRGHQCKGMFDYVIHNHKLFGDVLVELKTTKDASPNRFMKDVWNLGFDFQQAFYNIGTGDRYRHIVVAVEKVAPFAIGVYDFTHFIEIGRNKVNKAFDLLEECEASGYWHGYSREVDALVPASWMVGMSGEEQ